MTEYATPICGNHTCECKLGTEHVACSLCLKALYCSEECRMIDWPVHECANAVRVSKVNAILATPYYYEDYMPSEIVQSELENPLSPLNESYLLTHVGQDMQLTQWQQVGEMAVPYAAEVNGKSIGRGSDPSELVANNSSIAARNYEITVTDEHTNGKASVSFVGVVGVDSIYRGNKENKKANKIASDFWSRFVPKQSNSLLLWPEPKQKSGIDKFDRNGGYISAELKVDGMAPVRIDFEYPPLNERASNFTRDFLKKLEHRYNTKFPGKNEEVKYMQTLRAKTPDGTQVMLTMLVRPNMNTVELKDVEFLVPDAELKPAKMTKGPEEEREVVKAFRNRTTVPIYCDASKLSDMHGLTMALELVSTKIKAGMLPPAENAEAFDAAAAVVRKHAREMKDGQNPTMEVNAAVYTTVNALFEMQTVDAPNLSRNRVPELMKKLGTWEYGTGDAKAAALIKPIADALVAVREAGANIPVTGAKAWIQRKMNSAKKSKLDAQLDEWDTAINRFLRSQPPGTTFPLSMAEIQRGRG